MKHPAYGVAPKTPTVALDASRMPADWDLIEDLYAFVKDRANDRIWKAQAHHDVEATRHAKSALSLLQMSYADAKTKPYLGVAVVDYFRRKAMPDADHPDFQPEWRIDT